MYLLCPVCWMWYKVGHWWDTNSNRLDTAQMDSGLHRPDTAEKNSGPRRPS